MRKFLKALWALLNPKPDPPPPAPLDEIDPATIIWGDADVSKWPITARVVRAWVTRYKIHCETSPKPWPLRSYPSGPGGQGNWWLIGKVGGQWYAATSEWLGDGRVSQGWPAQFFQGVPPGEKVKRLHGGLAQWVPQAGETVGVMQSTFARDHFRTTNERTNIRTVTWP